MAYMQTSLGLAPQSGLPPQLLHPHHSPNEHLPPPGGPSASAGIDLKPASLARPNLNQQPNLQGPRPPQHGEPLPTARDREREEREQAQKAQRPNLNNRPSRPPQQGENAMVMREIDERKQFAERGGQGRPPQGDGGAAMMSFLEQQSREQQARQQKLGAPYRTVDLAPPFLQNPELLYQKHQEILASWKDRPYKQPRPEAPSPQQQQSQQQRQHAPGGSERLGNCPPPSSVGPGPLGLNPAAAGMVPRGHTTMMGTPGMLPPGPNMGPNMPANLAEYLADSQHLRGMDPGQRPQQEGARYKEQAGGGVERMGASQYKDMFMQFSEHQREQQRMQQQAQRPPSAGEGPGQRGLEAPNKAAKKQGGTASPSLDLEGPSQAGGNSVLPASRSGSLGQGPPSFTQTQRPGGPSAGPSQGPLQKTVLPRGKIAQSGGPVNVQQFPMGPERMGGSGQQLGMPKGYPFASSSGSGPNFGTGGLGSSSGRPIASQSFGALTPQQQKPIPQAVNLSLSGQSGPSGSSQLSRLVDLSAATQQRPVGPPGGNYLQRGGSLGPMPQGQAPPQKGGEAFARQQAKNNKGSGPANFAKPSSSSGGLFTQQRLPSPAHPIPQGMVVVQQHMGGVAMPGGDDKNWQYRNHGHLGGGESKLGMKKAEEESKKRERERRGFLKRQREQVDFELQYLQDQQQQQNDQNKKHAAERQKMSDERQKMNDKYAALAEAQRTGAIIFAQQQQAKAQAAAVRQQGGAKGQAQGRVGVAAPGGVNMHAQGGGPGGPGELGTGLTLGRNSGNVNPSNGGGNMSRNGTPGGARSHEMGPAVPHMQMARPMSRGANSGKAPTSGGMAPMPFQQKQGPVAPPVSRQSPPMPVQAIPDRRSGSPVGAQGRDAGGAQPLQPVEQQAAKADNFRQGESFTSAFLE
jgi:hypothetical protein